MNPKSPPADKGDRPSAWQIVARAFAAGVKPDPVVKPSTWAAEHFEIIEGPRAGTKWSPDEVPPLVEIIDTLGVDNPATEVWFMKSSQIGATTGGAAWLGCLIDTAPDTMLIVLPTGKDVSDFNQETLQETIFKTRPLRAKVRAQKSRSADGSTSLLKKFPGGWLRLAGGHSSQQLSRRTVRYVYADEVDRYPLDLEQQGDPMEMIAARQLAFMASGDWKRFVTSTPTVEGASRIAAGFIAGDQRRYNVPCPHCGALHRFDFWRLKYSKTYPHGAHYECQDCGGVIENRHKRAMMALESGARWIAENPAGRYPSFHLDVLYSPFVTWDQVVEKYLAAGVDPQKLKTFYNLWLGIPFEATGDAPDAERLFNRRADYEPGLIPPGGLFLTAGFDVQQNRIEGEVVAWGVGESSWSIDRFVIEGDTITAAPWVQLAEIINRDWSDWQGNRRKIEMAAVDANYRTQMVYAFARGRHNVIAVKGVGSHLAPVIGTPTRQEFTRAGKRRPSGVMLWPVGTWQIKADLYARLNLEGPSESGGFPGGWCHYPRGDLYDLAFFQQMTSESLVDIQRRGGIEKVWHHNKKFRNEALDCRVYAIAAAHRLGMGQWTAADWQKWTALRSAPPASGQMDLLAPRSAPAADPPPMADSAPPASPRAPENTAKNDKGLTSPRRPGTASPGSGARVGRTVGGVGRVVR
jgi:phage terminase large subunit GpA-like protein